MALEIDVKFKEKDASFNADFGEVDFLPVDIKPATKDTLGGIKVGEGLRIEEDGTLSTTNDFELPIASEETLGGIKIGNGLLVSEDGTARVYSEDIAQDIVDVISAHDVDVDEMIDEIFDD